MFMAFSLQSVDRLPQAPASDVKKLGWRGLMRAVGREGSVVVTNHDRPEAVILSTETYHALLQAAQGAQAQRDAALDSLRQRFDQRLAVLAQDDAADRLRAVMQAPAALGGRVKAGESH